MAKTKNLIPVFIFHLTHSLQLSSVPKNICNNFYITLNKEGIVCICIYFYQRPAFLYNKLGRNHQHIKKHLSKSWYNIIFKFPAFNNASRLSFINSTCCLFLSLGKHTVIHFILSDITAKWSVQCPLMYIFSSLFFFLQWGKVHNAKHV